MLALALALTAVAPSSGAQSAFDRGEFKQALELLAPRVNLLPPGRELGEVHLLRAQCFHALRQPSQVETALTLALMADPEVRFDANRVAPELVQTLAALALRLSGRLTLAPKGLEAGDQVLLDGEPVDKLPSTRSVSIGRHSVAVLRDGLAVVDATLVVRPGQELSFAADVPPKRQPEVPVVQQQQEQKTEEGPGPLAVMARVRIDPLRPGASFDLGLEVQLGLFRLALMGTRGQFWGGALRPSVVFQLGQRVALSVFAEAAVFVSSPVSVSLGGGGAIDVRIVSGLELFADVGGFYAPSAPAGVRSGYLLIGVGPRWRF